MQLANAVVFLTGANRGIGQALGFVDTDLTRGIDSPKSTPQAIARAAFDGLEAGALEVLADQMTRDVRQSLSLATPAYLSAQ